MNGFTAITHYRNETVGDEDLMLGAPDWAEEIFATCDAILLGLRPSRDFEESLRARVYARERDARWALEDSSPREPRHSAMRNAAAFWTREADRLDRADAAARDED